MYPTVVIVVVETQRSMADVYEISSSSNPSKLVGVAASEVRPATLGPLPFTVGQVHPTTDNEAESQLPRPAKVDMAWTQVVLEAK